MNRKTLIAVTCGMAFIALGSLFRTLLFSDKGENAFLSDLMTSLLGIILALAISRRGHEIAKVENSKDVHFEEQIAALQEKIGYLKAENAQLLKVAAGDAAPGPSDDAHTTGVILRQRAFLHDVSNPISIAQGMIELALRQLTKDPTNSALATAKLEKALKAVDSVAKQIQENREYLIMSAS